MRTADPPVDWRRLLAWLLAGVTVLGSVAQPVLLVASGVPLLSREANDQAFPVITVALVIGAVVGAMIVQRHPGHRIGWLFCFGQAGAAIGLAGQTLAGGVMVHRLPLPLQVGQVAAWVSKVVGASYALTLVGLLLMLVPDGRLPSRRWRPVFVLLVGGYAVVVVGLLLIPPSSFTPSGPVDTSPTANLLELIGQLAVTAGLVCGVIALVVRLRRSAGEERQQLRWIGVAALALALTLILYVTDNVAHAGGSTMGWLFSLLFYLGYLSVPVATGFAVLRYRLYDIDLIIGSAVRLAVLGAFVTVGYVALVVAIGGLIGGVWFTTWSSVLSYVLVALAFQPLRRHIGRLADRVVYGRRAAPYDSLAAFGRQLAATLSERELLLLVARSSVSAFGVRGACATVLVAGRDEVTECWPSPSGGEPADNTVSVPVRHDGEAVGRIGLMLAPGRSLSRADRRLLANFADRAAPAFRNAALAAALRIRAEELLAQDAELRAARRRLVTAAVIEREQVAAAIRTKVVAALEEFPVALVRLHGQVVADPAATGAELAQMHAATAQAIEALRAITTGVLPPLLARHGLLAALHTHAGRSAHRPVIMAENSDHRYGTSAETAAYAFCIWALDRFEPGARIAICSVESSLRVTVSGRESGGSGVTDTPGWQQVLDRVEAIGGRVRPVALDDSSAAVEAIIPAEQFATATD